MPFFNFLSREKKIIICNSLPRSKTNKHIRAQDNSNKGKRTKNNLKNFSSVRSKDLDPDPKKHLQ